MSLVAGILGMGRSQAVARFTETFTFFTAVETSHPTTFVVSTVETIIKAGVPGRYKTAEAVGRDPESGGQFPSVGRREIHVAVGAVTALPDTLVRCTGSSVDPGLVGRVFRVSERPTGGQVTAYRFPVEEIS